MKNENYIFKGKLLSIVNETKILSDGNSVVFEKCRRSPGVRLIIRKKVGNEFMYLISKEFRHELNTYDYRLAGGKVLDNLDEYLHALENNLNIENFAKQAAVKEAKEELGVELRNFEFIHRSVLGATIEWDLYYFLCEDFEELGSQSVEELEDIKPEWINELELKKMCLDGSFSEERSALVLLKFLLIP